MSIRAKALQCYKTKYGRIDIPIYTSKFYKPDESWPKKNVWWPKIPASAIKKYSHIHILCESAPGKNEFYHLKVSAQFLREHLKKFRTIGEKIIDFYLSTDHKRLFVEERGSGSLDFKVFLLNKI